MLEHAGQHPRIVPRRVDRLQREADVLADDVGRRPVDPGNLGRTPRQVLLVRHSKVRQPGEAGFDQHQLELRELLEHALGEEAEQLRSRTRSTARRSPRPDRRASPTRSARGDRCCRHGCRSSARAARRPRRSASRAGGPAASRPSRAAAPGRSARPRRGARSPRPRAPDCAPAPGSTRAGAARGRAVPSPPTRSPPCRTRRPCLR